MKKITQSIQETQALATDFLTNQLTSNTVALQGDLGAGKTTFVQGLALALGVEGIVNSPTFLIVKTYPLAAHPRFRQLIHIDLYRIKHWNELNEIDLPSLWNDPSNLVIIEWAERIKDKLPGNTQTIAFAHLAEDRRSIELDSI
jgi:tRNA threonylcarbamoyladenosine biosynthesis protein TsaE